MKTFKPFLTIKLLVFCTIFIFSGQAYALLINPDTTTIFLSGPENNQSDIDDMLNDFFEPDLIELYKDDVDTGESGLLQGSYETTFGNTPTDPSEADIVYTGGDIVGSPAFLLVKDGNQNPAWYLFHLTDLGWDGMESLDLNNFWPGRGAISHVTLYRTHPVPEPATMLLMGTGLVCLAGLGRKKFKK